MSTMKRKAARTGIEERHARSCRSRSGGSCSCKPTFQASVWSKRENRRIRRTFTSLTEAKAWRAEAQTAVRKGTLRHPSKVKLREAAEAWLKGAREGAIRNRSGDAYKPSVIRSYETSLRLHVLPDLGALRLSELDRNTLQDLADRMHASGASASTIRNALMPLRVICRRAVARGELSVNPCTALELPAVRGSRDRIAAPDEASRLLAALEPRDRALWATAMYAGLRRGELRALKWPDVDLAAGIIRVRSSWDRLDGRVDPKSRSGKRSVPIAAVLRDYLDEHMLSAGDREGFVFPASTGSPFDPSTAQRRADDAWQAAGLDRITLHECRHTYASFMIAAGVNAKALSVFMGHASITITLDRYGHLFPGSEDEAAGLLDAYLARADSQARIAALA